MRDYKKIKAWQAADKLVLQVYDITRSFPKDEVYGLTSQMRRAAVSVASNIVEGSGRKSNKDYLHFLLIAQTSARELEYLMNLSYKLDYIGDLRHRVLMERCSEAHRVLYGLVNAVSSSGSL